MWSLRKPVGTHKITTDCFNRTIRWQVNPFPKANYNGTDTLRVSDVLSNKENAILLRQCFQNKTTKWYSM